MRVDLDPKVLTAFHSAAQLNADLSYRKERRQKKATLRLIMVIEVDLSGRLISQ